MKSIGGIQVIANWLVFGMLLAWVGAFAGYQVYRFMQTDAGYELTKYKPGDTSFRRRLRRAASILTRRFDPKFANPSPYQGPERSAGSLNSKLLDETDAPWPPRKRIDLGTVKDVVSNPKNVPSLIWHRTRLQEAIVEIERLTPCEK